MALICVHGHSPKHFVMERTVKHSINPGTKEVIAHIETVEVKFFCPICNDEAEDIGG